MPLNFGLDASGNSNNWTVNNISQAAGTTYDSMLDVPSGNGYADGGNGRGNYCTLNPLDFNSGTVSNGNLQWASSTAVGNGCFGTFAFDIADSTNKYYWEMTLTSGDVVFGIVPLTTLPSNTSRTGSYSYYTNGNKYSGTSASAYGSTFTSGDVIGVAVGNGIITFYKNNVSQGSAFTGLTGFFKPAIWEVSGTFNANFGQRPFSYTPPTGFKALCTSNLPAVTGAAQQPKKHFDVVTRNGTSAAANITGYQFAPDFVWIKARNIAYSNVLSNVLTGATKFMQSNTTAAEQTDVQALTAFNSDGYSLGTWVEFNETGKTYVDWAWKANGTGVSNTAGTITSTVSANTTAGFSVVTYTHNGTNAATVGHGLGVTPSFIINKQRSAASNWRCYHVSLTAGYNIQLNLTQAQGTAADIFPNAPTSSVFTPGNGDSASGQTFVAYCFAAIPGYSAFGKYTGNGSTDGPFVYCGFRPRWLLIKGTTSLSLDQWMIWDTARNTYNVASNSLQPNSSGSENTARIIDILSNGFKPREGDAKHNLSNETYIYAAFAENPFKYSNAR